MEPKFNLLYCLPLRLSVLLVSFCQFLASILASGLLWWTLHHNRAANEISTRQKINVITFAITCTIAAIMSCFGFFSTLTKTWRHISRFSLMLNFVLGLQIVVGTICLILFFTGRPKFVDICISGSKDQNLIDDCNRRATTSNTIVITSVVIPPLIQLYACYIVAAYAEKLHHAPLIVSHRKRTEDFVCH